MSALTAIPAAVVDFDPQFFPCRYTWRDNGQEKHGNTVIAGWNEVDALEMFRRKHPNLTNVEIIKTEN